MFLWEPVTFNLKHCMPNKLFEFIQGRLAVAIGPSPDMAKFLIDNEIGIIAESFEPEALAEKLNKLTAESITEMKNRSHELAYKWNAERNHKVLNTYLNE